MAGLVDILLRIASDVRDAVTGIDSVGDSAKRADAQVDELAESSGRIGSRFDQVSDRAFSLGTAISGVATVAIEVFDRIDQFGRRLDEVLGKQQEIAKQTREFGEAISVPDLEQQFAETVSARGGSFQERGGIIGTVSAALQGAGRLLPGGTPAGRSVIDEREAVQFFGDIARGDPARARALLSGDLGRFEYLRERFERTLARLAEGRQFTEQINQNPATQVNIYMGVGDGQRAGEEARAILDRRDRNNGYYQTYTRPGR